MYSQVYRRRARKTSSAMAPRKTTKSNTETVPQGSDNISDTSSRASGSVATWSSISNILQRGLVNCSESDEDDLDVVRDDLNTKYKAIFQSGMHLVAARPRLLPYPDMIQWALDHVDLPTRTILNNQRKMVGTFRPEHIQAMYKLPQTSECAYGKEFLEEFKKKECEEFDRTLPGLIRDWVSRPALLRINSDGVYSISSLEPNFMYVAMMACRLYGREDTAHFFVQWVPLIYRVAEGFSFNWSKMLSDSLLSRVTEYRETKAAGKPAGFFMSAYIMDAICSLTPFPLMNWAWSPTQEIAVHKYHDKLWEENANDFIYEIFNRVMVPLHVVIFGLLPPRISDSIAGNLSHIADWYVEEEFSYLRVFGATVPPSALPQFIPDKLACREVARQTVIGGVSKELKASAKKVWPSFPIRLHSYSLSDFGHAKVEAAALEGLNLAYIEYKKHDPQKIVSTHLGNCGLKRFEHENSPLDDVFRGTRSYSEVQFRIDALPPEDRASVLKFQEHRRRCLPVVLGGLGLPKDKEKEAGSSGGQTSNPEKHQEKQEQKSPEREKSPKRNQNPTTEKEDTNPPKEHSAEVEVTSTNSPKTQSPDGGTKTSDPPERPDPFSTPGKGTKQIGQPIASVTPLQSTQGGVNEGWIFGEELEPIRAEELPPNEFFFDKKRKAVVKREVYQEGESTAKKFKVLTDGRNKKKEEFATEIAGTLGAYATANLYSVEMLKEQLKAKNRLIKTLEARLDSATENARNLASGEFKLAQLADKKEIEHLKTKLEQADLIIRDGRMQSGHQRDTITQLQTQLENAGSQIIDIEIIKSRAIDIRSRISSAQQSLLDKIRDCRKDCLLMSQISQDLIVKERDAEAARLIFQEAVIATRNRFSAETPGLSFEEQTRGNILLKNWEHDIALSKEQAKTVTSSLEETFKIIDTELIGMERGGDIETLRQTNMEQIFLDMKERNEKSLIEISKMDRTGMAQIEEHLIHPSIQLGILGIVNTYMEDRIPQLTRDCYVAEASCQADQSRLLSQFLDKCRICAESMQQRAPGTSGKTS
jgi:hypothetical protein